jgi:hypothetical protein
VQIDSMQSQLDSDCSRCCTCAGSCDAPCATFRLESNHNCMGTHSWLPSWHLQEHFLLLHHTGLLHTPTDLQSDDAQLLDQACLYHRHIREVRKPGTSVKVTPGMSVLLVQKQVKGSSLKAGAMGKL